MSYHLARLPDDCRVKLPQKSPDNFPFFMKSSDYTKAQSTILVSLQSPKFLYPVKDPAGTKDLVFDLKNKDTVVLLCTGSENSLELTEKQNGVLKCNRGQLELDDWVRCTVNNIAKSMTVIFINIE